MCVPMPAPFAALGPHCTFSFFHTFSLPQFVLCLMVSILYFILFLFFFGVKLTYVSKRNKPKNYQAPI